MQFVRKNRECETVKEKHANGVPYLYFPALEETGCVVNGFSPRPVSYTHLGMGTDAMSVDPADDENLTIHKKLMKYKDFVIVENLANLERIAGTMCLFLAFPLKYAGADGAPVRAAAVREMSCLCGDGP